LSSRSWIHGWDGNTPRQRNRNRRRLQTLAYMWTSADFPIGLLQMAQKVSVEPPAGIKAGLSRTFHTLITNDFLEKHDTDKWRKISYVICFLHSIV
jgi:hypothetical protein